MLYIVLSCLHIAGGDCKRVSDIVDEFRLDNVVALAFMWSFRPR